MFRNPGRNQNATRKRRSGCKFRTQRAQTMGYSAKFEDMRLPYFERVDICDSIVFRNFNLIEVRIMILQADTNFTG